VNFIFRHLIVHPETEIAAEASECARDQGKIVEFANLVFDSQDFTLPALKTNAETLGLNMTQFENCVNSREKSAIIERDYQDAMSRDVMGTPSFFVDGKQVSIEYLDLAIEEAINVRAQS
jgi:protein-disulfide isomerase